MTKPLTPRLELWFANQDGLVDLLGIGRELQQLYLSRHGESQRGMAQKQHLLAALLEERLADNPPVELQRFLLAEAPELGQLISIEQAFYFSRRGTGGNVKFHADLNTDKAWRLDGTIDPDRFPFSSTYDHLSGRRNVFMVATIRDVDGKHLTLRPLFVGHRTWANERGASTSFYERRVHPNDVDQFSSVDWRRSPTAAEMRLMNNMREEDVKDAIAEIIGVPFVPKDWGGERSDLTTNNLLVRGEQTSAAWLLKGRSVRGPMKIPHLGSNGDQIERLTTEPAELIVVQHNDAITAPVVNLASAFANDMRNPRRYMIMDGHLTAMILRDHALLR